MPLDIAAPKFFCKEILRNKNEKNTDTNLDFSEPDWDRSPISSAYLSGRSRESDGNNLGGAVSKLLILWAK